MHRSLVKAFDNQKGITITEAGTMPFTFVVVDEVLKYPTLLGSSFSTQKAKGIIYFRLD